MDQSHAIAFPSSLNGTIEVGIAAGADICPDAGATIRVLYRFAHPDLTLQQVAAWNADLDDGKPTLDTDVFTKQVLEDLGYTGQADIPSGATINVDDFAEVAIVQTIMCLELQLDSDEAMSWYRHAIGVALQIGAIHAKDSSKNVVHMSVLDSHDYYNARVAAADALPTPKEITDLLSSPATEVLTLLASTKVSWWLTNHHVGTAPGKIASYAGKVHSAQSRSGDINSWRTAMWAAGKAMVTKRTLDQLGIEGIDLKMTNEEPMKDFTLSSSKDLAVRMAARPAGTAKSTTPLAVLDYASRSAYSVIMPAVVELDRVRKSVAGIADCPARYHEGSAFLTGHAQLKVEAFSEDSFMNIAAWIAGVAPNGHLAKAPVFPPVTDLMGNTVYTTVSTAKATLVGMGTDAMIQSLMQHIRPGGDGGGFALQCGLIDDDAVKAAKAAAQKAAAKGVGVEEGKDGSALVTKSD